MIRLSLDDFLPRYMDDFFNSIAAKHRKLGDQRVDITLFLDLDKTLAPWPVKT